MQSMVQEAGEEAIFPVDYQIFRSDDGKETIFKAKDGSVFDSELEVRAYVEQNRVSLLVAEFERAVRADLPRFVGNKKGEIPGNERALQAQVTRLTNHARLVFEWDLKTV